MARERSGFELPLLLLGAFRSLVDELHAELAGLGHAHARPVHGFALQALGPDGATISELGRRLGVSKQAAAKTAGALEEAGYAARRPHPHDGRAWVLHRTSEGTEMLALSARIFGQLRQEWARQLGSERIRQLEDDLEAIAGTARSGGFADLPGWLR